MVETVVAAADLVNAVPSFWEAIKVPVAIALIIAGAIGAIVGLHKGFATAAGKLLGGIALGAIALGAVGLMMSAYTTVNHHTGGVLSGQYGN